MLVNGILIARAGTALVAMAAHEHGVPVLVCCETYKFTERVLLDSICYNELGNPDQLLPSGIYIYIHICIYIDATGLHLLQRAGKPRPTPSLRYIYLFIIYIYIYINIYIYIYIYIYI